MTQPSGDARLRRAVEIIQDLERRLAEREDADTEPIAIVGMACRLPGCDSPEELWQLLDEGRDPIADPPAPGAAFRGQLDDLDRLDAGFFRISAREAAVMDPRQRLALEAAWEALERAGIPADSLEGVRVGVYVGVSGFASPRGEERDLYDVTGALPSVIAGRVSFALGLQGPCMSVDTACSASLVAVHLACRALRAGECSMALAGGVSTLEPSLLSPHAHVPLAKAGRCRTFDAGADGIVMSEGSGMLVLKRLGDARSDGDRVLALVRGSALSHDGRAQGLTVPSMEAQEDVLRAALADARVSPDEVSYVECHGTGTILGDPIEVQAIGSVFGSGRERPLMLGSIKSNIGHTDATAGLAGVLKVVLALQRGRIPANLHFEAPNPHIPWDRLPVAVADRAVPWPTEGSPRLAGVSAFGISGTNAHVVLEEPPRDEAVAAELPPRSAELVLLSARSEEALADAAARLESHLAGQGDLTLRDVAYSAAVTRTHHEHRLALSVGSRAELAEGLRLAARGEMARGASRGVARAGRTSPIVFVFPGQGAQRPGMGRELLAEEPAFRRAMEACDRAIAAETGWSVIDEIAAPADRSRMDQVDVLQPALFAMAVSLAALWRSWGVEPAVVIGQSQGELPAAVVSGALSLEDAAAVICRRSRIARRIVGQGEMATVQLPLAEARAALAGFERELSVAGTIGRRTTALSGGREAMAEVLARLEAQGVFCRRIKGSYAGHGPQVECLRDELVSSLAHLSPGAPSVPMRSTLTGEWVRGGELTATYWADAQREPVRLVEGIEAILAEGHAQFLELSPHPVLLPVLDELVGERGVDGVAVGSLVRDQGERGAMLAGLGRLHVRGLQPRWTEVFSGGGRRVSLPTYPWQRERHWLDAPPDRREPAGGELVESAARRLADRGALSEVEQRVLTRLIQAIEETRAASEVADWFYSVDWHRLKHGRARRPDARPGPWLVGDDGTGAAEILAGALVRAGLTAVVAPSGDGATGMRAALESGPLAGVIVIDRDEREALALMRLLAAREADAPRLWLVTRGAVATSREELLADPDAGALWGLGRSFALEHPRAWGGLLDLPASALDDGAADRAVAWMVGSEEDQIAVRDGAAFAPRLVPRAPAVGDGPGWTTSGTALVTGGLGGLGLELARWLVRRGQRHVLLTGRRGLDTPGASEAVEELGQLGADVRVARADVADRQAMEEATGSVAAPITAVFHAAGVNDRTPIADLDDETFARVLAPKRAGTQVLAELALGCAWPLEAFVCFSSCAGVWGFGGQAAYAASNAYLDAWAHAARAQGLPALSVSWGQWAEQGMAAGPEATAYAARRGFRAMPAARALAALELALAGDRPHVVVTDMEWTAFRKAFESWRPRPLLAALGRGADAVDGGGARAAASAWLGELRQLAPDRRRAAILQAVRAEAARVLSMSSPEGVADDLAFKELGLDSVMAVELRNALGRRLGAALPATIAFDHPTPAALADALLARVDQGETEEAWEPDAARGARADEARLGRMALGQERLWFLDRLAPTSGQYNELFALERSGPLDLERLRDCLGALVRRHESLRMTFPEVAVYPDFSEEPRALVAPDGAVSLEAVDLRDHPDPPGRLAELAEELRARPFDLARGPLWRGLVATLSADEHVLVLALHHIIVDGVSWRILGRELVLLHEGGGDPAALPEQRFDYADHVRHERARRGTPAHEEALAWWKARLAGMPRLELPWSRAGRLAGQAGGRVPVPLSPELGRAVQEFARREGCTVYETLLAAWASVLHRFSAQTDLAIGAIVSNRTRSELDPMVGFFLNTLVLRCDLSGRPSFRELVGRVGQTVSEARAHQDVDLAEVVRALRGELDADGGPILQTTVNLLPVQRDLMPGWAWADSRLPPSPTAKFDLSLEFLDDGGQLRGMLEYASDLLERGAAERLAGQLSVLLEAALARPDRPVGGLPLLDPSERQRLLVDWNDTGAELPDRCVHELFGEWARRSPGAAALVFQGAELTYAQLDERANQLAHHLLALELEGGRRIGPGALVAVCLERSAELVVALLAILKAGAAYLPLDPAHPSERLALMLTDSRAPVLLTRSELAARAGAHPARPIELDRERDAIGRHPVAPPPAAASLDDLAYVLYTSGSTGTPKGVEVGHRGLAGIVAHFAGELEVTSRDALLAVTSLSFDISGLEIFLPLTRGACCRLASREQASDAYLLLEEVERATIMQATPATWHMLVEAGWSGSPRLRALCGGEALPWRLAVQLSELTGRVWNCYGPTETTIWSTVWPVEVERGGVSLGRGIANTRLHVLDAGLEPIPVGIPGELFIGGVGLARGYLGRPGLTAERFVADPFQPGERLYRTGDRVRWSPDGTLEFLDRLDHQVKVRGFRIELGEIEAVLGAHPAVSRCAVVAFRSGPEARLVGYYVPRDDGGADAAALREHLRATLPEPMIPSLLVELAELPLNQSGKVDRKALAARPLARAPEAALLPRDELEQSFARVWTSILEVEPIDAGRTFFEQGGTSLQLVKLQRRLREDLGIEAAVADLFAYPSIESFAEHVRAREAGRGGAGRRGEAGERDAVRDRLRDLEDLSLAELQRAVKVGLRDVLDEELF